MIPHSLDRFLAYVPNWVIGVGVLAGTMLAALTLFQALSGLRHRLIGARHPALNAFLNAARPLLRFATVLLALALVAPVLPFGTNATEAIHRILIASFV